jgi:TolB-like protein/DNA-binding XRE family transcriptional regulator/Tfp pilus assembly protein PilF
VERAVSFGQWLRQRRRALGLTHAMLAQRSHCSVSTLRKIEQDERAPSYRLAERLASNLRISAAELAHFLAIARGERRIERLGDLSAIELPPLPAPHADPTAAAAMPAARDPAPQTIAAFEPTMPSIAVLPFINLSDDAANEHFADGLAEELLNVLAKIPGVRVASRTSAFSFKGNRELDVPSLARRLNVSTVLEGSIRKWGRRVRITAQLVRAASDSSMWSQSYDRELDDIFAVQDDIAQSVVQELRSALLGEPADADASARARAQVLAATRGRTGNPQAHELYLLGRFLIDRLAQDDTATGIGYYRQALHLDPRYALAWAGLAGAYSNQAGYGWAPMAQASELARTAARHALELEPELAEGHAELGWVQMCYEWDWHAADASYARALGLGAGNRSIVSAASVLADSLGRKDDAVMLARRAAALDPLSFIAHGNLALRCLNSGLLDEAATALDHAFRLNPRAALLRAVLGTLRLEQGRPDEALAAFQQEDAEPLRLAGIATAQHALGRRPESEATLQDLIDRCAEGGALQIAEVFAYRGDADLAFEWLERARLQRDAGLAQLQSWPLLRNLHGDPRWQPFLEKMGLVERSEFAIRAGNRLSIETK